MSCLHLFQNTRLDCLLVWILLSGSFLFVFRIFVPRPKRETGQKKGKNPEKLKHRKQKENKCYFQFAQLCSETVFLFGGVGVKMHIWLKKHEIVVSKEIEQQKLPFFRKVESISGPSMLRNIVGPGIDRQFWLFLNNTIGFLHYNSNSPRFFL